MHYTTEKLPNEPITIWTGYEGFEWASTEEQQSNDELRVIWDRSPELVYHIVDMSHMSLNLEQLMKAAADVALGEDALWNHPKLKIAIIVTQDQAIVQAVTSMIQAAESGQSAYARVPMMTMSSVDVALDYSRKQRR